MNSRSAARELVILALPQLPKDKLKLENIDFNQITLALSRSLSDYAKKNILAVGGNLAKMENYLLNAEIEHPDNEEHTSQIKSVLIPDTANLKEQIKILEAAANELYNVLDIPELTTHIDQEQTTSYAKALFENYLKNKETIDSTIESAAQSRKDDKKWKLNRMVRVERDIFRIATTELLYFHDTPVEVICDEAVKIAEKYGGDESKKFVNGVIRDIVELTRVKK